MRFIVTVESRIRDSAYSSYNQDFNKGMEAKMKKGKYLIAGLVILALLFTIGGCGVSEEQISTLYEKVDSLNSRMADSEAQVTALSAISAYQLWFDQYYSLGTYSFPDIKTFNRSCGRLISKVNDVDAVAAWNIYLQADKAYYDLFEILPKDTATWTKTQYDQWVDLNTARSDALGQVGATLFNAIGKKD